MPDKIVQTSEAHRDRAFGESMESMQGERPMVPPPPLGVGTKPTIPPPPPPKLPTQFRVVAVNAMGGEAVSDVVEVTE